MEKISPECVATVNETCAEDVEQSLAEDVKVSATEERSETLLDCDFIVEEDSTRLLSSY